MQCHHAVALQPCPGLHAAGPGGRRNPSDPERTGGFGQVRLAGARVETAIAGAAVHLERHLEWRGSLAQPRIGTPAHAVSVHPQPQVDARQAQAQPKLWRAHVQAGVRHLQFAQPL